MCVRYIYGLNVSLEFSLEFPNVGSPDVLLHPYYLCSSLPFFYLRGYPFIKIT
jgi:hypothetical protein